jgi:oleandomycin transport system permease protein
MTTLTPSTGSATAPTAPRGLTSPVAADAHPEPPRFRLLRHSVVLAKRNLVKTWRTPEQLIDVTIQPIIFLILFVYVFGGAISHGSQHQYLEYVLPGLVGQGIAMGSVALGQNMNADIEKGLFDRFRSLPIARSAPLVGAVFADFFRYLIMCVIFIGFGYILGYRITTNPLSAAAAVALAVGFALSFCWISLWVGLKARTPGAVQGIMFLLILPLSFGSSTFVAVDTMPGWLQAFVKVNPITHLVGAVRGLMIGGPVADPLVWTFAWMAGLLAVFVPLALRGYRKRI